MLQTIKSLLNINDEMKDVVIHHYIVSYKQQIMNYCNLTTFPMELESLVVEIIVEKSRNETKVASRGDISFQHSVSEISLDKYDSQLSNFKRVRVV